MDFSLHLLRGVWGLTSRLDRPSVKSPEDDISQSGHYFSKCPIPSFQNVYSVDKAEFQLGMGSK